MLVVYSVTMVFTQSQISDIQAIINNSIKSLLTDKAFLANVASTVAKTVEASLQPVLQEINDKLVNADKIISTLQIQNDELVEENKRLKSEIDAVQQYSRRNNIRIYGIKETDGEDTDRIVVNLFKEKLNVDLDIHQIDRSHRVGADKTRSRHIIVKFISYRDKRKVLQNRKFLKASGISIEEDLTKERLNLFKTARAKLKKENVWTHDGLVWIRHNRKKLILKSLNELYSLD